MAKPDRLLAEARRRLENEHTDFVFIATNDGGIKAEAALWHTKLGLQVFTAINIDGLHSALIIIVEALKKRRE
ncbi:MAG: hypothetical protein NTX35_00025, partial [Verrucomicrobia bacterium]|nr:hypothetical protein [Verrucomicrobiota bacterium]